MSLFSLLINQSVFQAVNYSQIADPEEINDVIDASLDDNSDDEVEDEEVGEENDLESV